MTRIYTNVPSMIARTNLNKNMSALSTSLERLSTGFKINSGKDDPAGLIASEMLRSDITGMKTAIKNTERANMMIATADSALNEVTNLLNDIRGLVTEAASTGTMSAEMIKANQLQVDASLDAIDRIAAQTTFMGKKLLDGSLDFNLTGLNRNDIQGLSVNQATLSNDGPTQVTINVRQAAEKAALYYNQPALAESLVLHWGGSYGYDMQTFEKGATVAEIAKIINERSDGTGVVAEVGSDALKGQLYVSSLGNDNDIIIDAGLAGLNGGNVEIKYLRGSSEGIQVKYEEPTYAGAPAKVLVYLQTEAYDAAFADDIETTWTTNEKGELVPMRDNNALKFESEIEGSQYNGANIYYVDGSLTDSNFYTDDNPTGTAGMPYAYYSDTAKSATALFGNVPYEMEGSTQTGGVNNTSMAFSGLEAGEYFTIQSAAGGSQYNNTTVQFVAAGPSDVQLGGRRAAAAYRETLDINGNITSKTLTVYYNNDGTTTLQDVQEALTFERHIGSSGTTETGAFKLTPNIGTKSLTDITMVANPSGTMVSSSTHNSGGEANSLFIVMPPDGMMPARPNTPEVPGVTDKMVGDGLYLAHKGSEWDNYQLDFARNATVPGTGVTVALDSSTNKITITANAGASYDDILNAINGTGWVGGKPGTLLNTNMYWSDSQGNEKIPGTPSGLAATTDAGVVGRSATAITTVDNQQLYLGHTHADLDGYNVEFKYDNTLSPNSKFVAVSGDTASKRIVVTYNANTTYDEILSALNQDPGYPQWGKPASGNFTFISADGKTFGGATPPVNSLPAIDDGGTGTNLLHLTHADSSWNGKEIVFEATTNTTGTNVDAVLSGNIITVNYDGAATWEDILDEINSTKPIGGSDDLIWTASVGTYTAGDVNTIVDGTRITLGSANPTGIAMNAGSTLRTVNSGSMIAKTTVPVGDQFYLGHTNSQWDKYTFNFIQNDQPGGSVKVTLDGTVVTVTADSDVQYEEILDALNNPSGRAASPGVDPLPAWTINGTSPWSGVPVTQNHTAGNGTATVSESGGIVQISTFDNTTAEEILALLNAHGQSSARGDFPLPITEGTLAAWNFATALPAVNADDALFWVNSANTRVTPGIPTSLVASTNSGVYQEMAYSEDGRSTEVGNGLYLQHTNKSWDDIEIKFSSTGADSTLATPPTAPNINVIYDVGTKTISVMADINATYDQILAALNDPTGANTNLTTTGSPTEINGWTGWKTPNGNAPTTFPTAGDLRWVDANGKVSTVTNMTAAVTPISGDATNNVNLTHSDPDWDKYTLRFESNPAWTGNEVEVVANGDVLTIRHGATATFEHLRDALNGTWTGKPIGIGDVSLTTNGTGDITATLDGNVLNTNIQFSDVTYSTKTSVPNPPINSVVDMGQVVREITANDIAAIFDLENNASRGSERAASMFHVSSTVDNDGTGLIRLYDYYVNAKGEPTDPGAVDAKRVYVKTAFENAFGGGVTGGDVITTAAELVTALNNSAYWGTMMCPELIAELAAENAQDKYYDASNPPVITARLAPGNHGLFAVSTFEEVAYYGNPNEGNALQFLGDKNSPNIRYVVDGPNSELSIDRTTVPAEEGLSQAVLTAQDSGASLTITATKKGEAADDVQFVFKRVSEDARMRLDPDRRDGWVEYDPNTSFAEAQATFKDATTNQVVDNTAFYVTSTERGDMYNNVSVMMRLDDAYVGADPVNVVFDSATNQLRVSIDSTKANTVTTNDVIAAINKASVGFEAQLSFSEDPLNDGTGLLSNVGLTSASYLQVGNTGETGGHKGGTVTVWLADENPGPGGEGGYVAPTQEDIVRLINADEVVGKMFTARAYNTVQTTDGKQIDFVKDGPIVSSGGLIEKALITVHLGTDQVGNITTTAKDLETWWNTLDPALVDGISASIVRPAGAVWDDCNDPYGNGLLAPTISLGECDELIINDIQFVGWNDTAEQQQYVAMNSSGVMTSQRGIDSSYQLVAKNVGPEWDGYTIEYINDDSLTGRFADNLVSGSSTNPCDDPVYSGLQRDDCGNLITPNSTTEKGMSMVYDEAAKKITINVKFGVTTANDIEQLIENDPRTRSKFEILQLGKGTGLVDREDDTLLTKNGAGAPGNLNGAKLLFGEDASEYYLVLKSTEYGSDQFVHAYASGVNGASTTFTMTDAAGNSSEKVTGKDADVVINGISASADGLDVSLNTSTLSLDFSLSEPAGTTPGYTTAFGINGGGATFQVGPDVVTRQQISMGIRSINTVQLGGVSGVLNELRSGHSANLDDKKGGDTNKAFRIVEESLSAVTSIRGRLGTMQRATLETNINVLNDTLDAITEAESQIRDTDFAEETANMTRAQILVQANMSTLSIANQIPNYMLSLLGG